MPSTQSRDVMGEHEGTLADRLRDALGSDRVSTDERTRHAYATDASPCFVRPLAVVHAASARDVRDALEACRELRVPVTPRAGGTSLSGAAIGPGVVLDTTRMNDIGPVDVSSRTVRVGPGVLLRELNAHLASKGLRFPLEPGSLEWCRIGGMVGHNASGYRSVKYGQTRDHVLSLRVVLVNGEEIEARDWRIDEAGWADLLDRVPAFDDIRRTIVDHRAAILSARRPVRKHASGLDLPSIAEALDRGVFPLPSLFVGSEGTLGVVTDVTLRLDRRPSREVTLLLYPERLEDLARMVQDLLPLQPSAIEAVDAGSLDLVGREGFGIPSDAGSMLLIEFDGDDVDDALSRVEREILPKFRFRARMEVAEEPRRQEALWRARRAVFPALLGRPGRRRPWGFVEDPIVPLPRVPEFVSFLRDLTDRYGTVAGVYGHIGDGNTHYRPLFDPTDPGDFERMRALRNEFDGALLDRFGGAPSAEHGMGRIRAALLERTWGVEVARAMRAVKDALDPLGLLNPGVLFSDAPWWETWAGLDSRSPQ
jgi:FAD/FMN-containing dehydrogenase